MNFKNDFKWLVIRSCLLNGQVPWLSVSFLSISLGYWSKVQWYNKWSVVWSPLLQRHVALSNWKCMYVCTHIYMYVCICVCMYVWMYYACMYVRTYVCICLCMYVFFFYVIYWACSTAHSSTTCRTDFLLHRFYIRGFVCGDHCSFIVRSVNRCVVCHQSLLHWQRHWTPSDT